MVVGVMVVVAVAMIVVVVAILLLLLWLLLLLLMLLLLLFLKLSGPSKPLFLLLPITFDPEGVLLGLVFARDATFAGTAIVTTGLGAFTVDGTAFAGRGPTIEDISVVGCG